MQQQGHEPETYVVAKIRETLAKHPSVNELGVQVTIVGDRIFITGNVQTAERQSAITEVVSEICPDCRVSNETTIVPHTQTEGAETLQ